MAGCGRAGRYKNIYNYTTCCGTSTVASYDPGSQCQDIQYELVRQPQECFNPWAPVQAQEILIAAYPREDPWAAEQQNFNSRSSCGAIAGYEQFAQQRRGPPSLQHKYTMDGPATAKWVPKTSDLGGGCASGTCGSGPVAATKSGGGGCGSEYPCGESCDTYEYCFAPACSTVRPCRDYGPRPYYWKLPTAPI